jgi:hypothetical protein
MRISVAMSGTGLYFMVVWGGAFLDVDSVFNRFLLSFGDM